MVRAGAFGRAGFQPTRPSNTRVVVLGVGSEASSWTARAACLVLEPLVPICRTLSGFVVLVVLCSSLSL